MRIVAFLEKHRKFKISLKVFDDNPFLKSHTDFIHYKQMWIKIVLVWF